MPPITNKDINSFEIALNTLVNEIIKFGDSLNATNNRMDIIASNSIKNFKHQQYLVDENGKLLNTINQTLIKNSNDKALEEKNAERISTKPVTLKNKIVSNKVFRFIVSTHFVFSLILFAIFLSLTILSIQRKEERMKRDALKYRLILKLSNPNVKRKYQVWDSVANKQPIEELENALLK